MNEIVINLIAGDKLIPEMHLEHNGYTYSACGPFKKAKKEYKNFKKEEIQDIFIKTN